MGGGGGGYFESRSPEELRRQVEESRTEEESQQYETSVARILDSYLSEVNDRDVAQTRAYLDRVRTALENELDGTIDLLFGGSVAKHTYVEGLSDVDSLVMLDNCELAEAGPGEAKRFLADALAREFGQGSVTTGQMAVTLNLPNAQVQLLPAVSCRGGVQVSDESGEAWARVRPREFARKLTEVNQANGSKVVPVVKLAKAIIGQMGEGQRISGYHAESLAVEIFQSYDGRRTTKAMLGRFFTDAASRVLRPIRDSSGQSVHVDDSLGDAESLRRRVISDAFSRVARRMRNADASGRVVDWQRLFGMD